MPLTNPELIISADVRNQATPSDYVLMIDSQGIPYKISKDDLFGTPSGTGTSLLLDGLTNVTSARSTRKILSTYTGNALEVQLTNGNKQNIGFSDNNLDGTTLNNFAGSGSAYISKLYDQVGSFHATQSTIESAPQIVNLGNLQMAGDQPTIAYNNNQFLKSAINTQYPLSIIAVVKISSNTNGAFIKFGNDRSGVGIGIGGTTCDNAGINLIGLNEAIAWIGSNANLSTSQMSIVEINSTGSHTDIYLNGILAASGTSSNSPTTDYYIGGYTAGGAYSRYPICSISEDIVFNTILDSSTREKIVNNMKSYYKIT